MLTTTEARGVGRCFAMAGGDMGDGRALPTRRHGSRWHPAVDTQFGYVEYCANAKVPARAR
jgi:hypothetical protein